MAPIDPTQAISQFVGNLPTFVAVILAWMHANTRAGDIKNDLERQIHDSRELLRSEFRRVEEVMDARIKHLEEREH